MGSCIYKPALIKNNKEVESKLFNDLLSLTGNRESSKYLWGLSQVKEFTDNLEGLQLDENGEVTIESYNKALNIKELLNGNTTLLVEKRQLGAIDSNDNPIEHINVESIIEKVINFNKENQNLVADISRSGDKYVININNKTLDNQNIPENLMFSNSLNNHLRMLMNSLGFEVEVKSNLGHAGIFNPLQGEQTAGLLKTVIQVAEGKVGEEAFPEEFSHFIFDGLIKEPLVQRVLTALQVEGAVEAVLKDEYDQYNELYKGDSFMLRKEAAGKLMHAHITKAPVEAVHQNLISRLWNLVKNKIQKLSQSNIDKAINDANLAIEKITPAILDGSLLPLFDKSLLQDSKPLFKIASKIDKMQQISEDALRLYSKRIKILQARSKNGKYSDKDLEAIKKLQKLNEEKKYARSSMVFLTESLSEIQKLQSDINGLSEINSGEELIRIGSNSKVLRRTKEFIDAYSPIITDMTAMESFQERGEVLLSKEEAIKIAQLASEITKIIAYLNTTYRSLRFNTVFNFQKQFFGEDKMIGLGKNKTDRMTLEMILTMSEKDISGADRWLNTMGDSSDPLLSLIDKVVKTTHSKRDNILERLLFNLRATHIELTRAGHNTDFMFEKDSNGKITDKIISDIDFVKFKKNKEEFIKKLKDKGTKNYIIQTKLEAWERRNMESILVDKETGRIEVLPSKKMYSIDRLSKLDSAQKKYYDDMMQLKAQLDSMIPAKHAHMYNSIYIRNNLVEGVLNNISDPRKSSKMLLETFKDKFLVRSDDTDYAQPIFNLEEYNDWVALNNIDVSTPELEQEAEKKYNKYLKNTRLQILTDFSNKRVETMPVYYVNPLEDLDRLSTDFTSSMLAYAAMAVNYHEMNKIVDVMELTRDLLKERKVQQMKGDKKLVDSFKAVNKVYEMAYTKKGSETRTGARIDSYYAAEFYGERKLDEGSIKLFGSEISISKTGDTIKAYTGEIGLALNAFSSLNNAVVGKYQMFLEAIGGEYYGLKDSAIAKKNYYANLPDYLGEINSIVKNNKMGLLSDKFDALEEFNSSLKGKDFYKNAAARILGKTNTRFMSTAGEHYLHVRNMLAMLNSNKVLDKNGKEISIYEAYTTKEYKDASGKSLGSILVFKDGVKTLNGEQLFTLEHHILMDSLTKKESLSKDDKAKIMELDAIKSFTDNKMNNLKMRIGKVSQSLNGAFNEIDKGEIHKYVLGRMAMQFRQWMPAHYNRRLGSAYYDTQLDQWREGYYRTIGRFAWNSIVDIRRLNFHLATNWAQLNNHEKANIKRASAELSMFAILSGLIAMMGPEKDKKGLWAQRVLIYQLKRLKLEISASIPIHPDIIDNLWTMLQSPIPSVKSFNSLGDLVQFWNLFNEVESGRYKGWSVYKRDAYNAMPYINHIRKVQDITEEDYMFNIFK